MSFFKKKIEIEQWEKDFIIEKFPYKIRKIEKLNKKMLEARLILNDNVGIEGVGFYHQGMVGEKVSIGVLFGEYSTSTKVLLKVEEKTLMNLYDDKLLIIQVNKASDEYVEFIYNKYKIYN